jgi:RNA polymerase sigma-70 factor (ECF subfamily)
MEAVMRRASAVRTARAEPDRFVELYERTAAEVYSYLASRVADRGTAEDLTQEVFVAGAKRAAAGDSVDLPWLIGVARHKLVDHWRSQARADRNLTLARGLTGDRLMTEPIVIEPGRATLVLASLNATYRTALVLRHVDGLSVGAVAEHLGRSLHATEQILSRARAAFRHEYQGAVDE